MVEFREGVVGGRCRGERVGLQIGEFRQIEADQSRARTREEKREEQEAGLEKMGMAHQKRPTEQIAEQLI